MPVAARGRDGPGVMATIIVELATSENVTSVSPMVMTSPLASTVSSVIVSPLTSVPLPEPRSLTVQPLPTRRSMMCLRETEVSWMQIGLSVARPTTYSPSSRLNSSPALGPADTTSLGPLNGIGSARTAAAVVPVLRTGRWREASQADYNADLGER